MHGIICSQHSFSKRNGGVQLVFCRSITYDRPEYVSYAICGIVDDRLILGEMKLSYSVSLIYVTSNFYPQTSIGFISVVVHGKMITFHADKGLSQAPE